METTNNHHNSEQKSYFYSDLPFELMAESEKEKFFEEEELTFLLMKNLNNQYLDEWNPDSKNSSLLESIDIQKASEAMKPESFIPLPLHLKRYVELELKKEQKQKKSIIIQLFEKGSRLLNSILPEPGMKLVLQPATTVRSQAVMERSSVKIEETLNDTSTITYQVIKESEEEAYLYVKFDSNTKEFDHVNLKNRGRLIYSNTLSREGVITFSGLRPGEYNLEFVGLNQSKSIDLEIISE